MLVVVAAAAAKDGVKSEREQVASRLVWQLRRWQRRALAYLHAGIALLLPTLVRRSVRRDLAGVWGDWPDPPPARGAIVIANHHSWWDGYIAWLLTQRAGRPFAVLVDDVTLDRYPFFERLGALPRRALRAAVRRVRDGAWLFVFPEGELGASSRLAPFEPGAGVLSRLAQVPIQPLAWRVAVRAGQYPEVYVRAGAPLAPGSTAAQQHAAVAALLDRLDADMRETANPANALPGYTLWFAGRSSAHERAGRWRHWWGGGA